MKSPFYSTSTWGTMKFKELLQTLIVSHIRRASHSFSKMKLVALELKQLFVLSNGTHLTKFNKRTRKINLYESFRLHYNWCSSSANVAPEPPTDAEGEGSVVQVMEDLSKLSGYLNWLEERREEVDETNEIDKLADLFIANCHQKFMLEKQESYRMFQEMMARSI